MCFFCCCCFQKGNKQQNEVLLNRNLESVFSSLEVYNANFAFKGSKCTRWLIQSKAAAEKRTEQSSICKRSSFSSDFCCCWTVWPIIDCQTTKREKKANHAICNQMLQASFFIRCSECWFSPSNPILIALCLWIFCCWFLIFNF